MEKIKVTPLHVMRFIKNSATITHEESKLWLAVINNAVVEYDLDESIYLEKIERLCELSRTETNKRKANALLNKIAGLESRLSVAKGYKGESMAFFESTHFDAVCNLLGLNPSWTKKIIYSVGTEVTY